MDFMKAFMDQNMIAMIGEIVLFANTVTMAMPTRWRGNMFIDMVSKGFNFLAMNVFFITETWTIFHDNTDHIRWNPRVIGFGILVGC